MTILRVSELSKSYIRYGGEFQRILSWFGMQTAPSSRTEVFRDISFELAAGEALGIVGINGAGKSTLLKIITGTLQPSTGSVSVSGRIAAILELAMGFNPDLTGEENVIHGAGLMGFSRAEILAKMPEIEAFAEVGDYFRKPFRIYSSGMQVRVAFAVATAWRPDLLVIDEALSVGDTYFQQKSFKRIEAMKSAGTALLFVSHDRSAILKLCDKALLLSEGSTKAQGVPEAVMNIYNAMLPDLTFVPERLEDSADTTRPFKSGNQQFQFTNVRLLDENRAPVNTVEVGELVTLELVIQANTSKDSLTVGYEIKDRLGYSIFGTNSFDHRIKISEFVEGETFTVQFSFSANLGPGSYSISCALHTGATHVDTCFEWRDLALTFDVLNINKKSFIGACWIEPEITVIR